jgi:hypothetical protein
MQSEVRTVTLPDIDVEVFWRMQRHQDDMLREFALIAMDREDGGSLDVPARLLDIVGSLHQRYASPRSALLDRLEQAAEEGRSQVTVVVELPAAAAADVAATCRAYEEADAFCRRGDLLTLAAAPDVAALRDRLCATIVAQLTSR